MGVRPVIYRPKEVPALSSVQKLASRHVFVMLLALVALAAPVAPAGARVPVPHITSVRCWPPKACTQSHVVAPGGTLRLTGRNLRAGMLVLFPHRRTRSARAATVAARLRRAPASFHATVPWSAKSGRVRVAAKGGRRSNAAGPIRIRRPVKAPPTLASQTVLDGTGMWIWYVSKSSGGDPAAITAQAKRYGVVTVFIKSSDGGSWWSQFSPELLAALKAGGLRVCAWQYVYGDQPAAEAALGVRAAQTGADCLVIDAESQYQGKYAQAQTYMTALRSKLGVSYPIGLAGFPYVDYHPAFPYSVFLGPNGAQYNLPQVYWKAIGTTVDRAVAHTYLWNAPYGRPIFPLGQLYGGVQASDVKRFRQVASAYGARGVSWWDWQEATPGSWTAINAPLAPIAPPPPTGYPLLKRGSSGDLVLWAQEHLISAGQVPGTDGKYGASTEQAVRNFQASSALAVTGQLDSTTWAALLGYEPAPTNWSKARAAAASTGLRSARSGPRSAQLPAVRDELHGKGR
jgi:Putative peptidoglycan binding domain